MSFNFFRHKTPLNRFVLSRTKTFCNEGGCGCCVINAQVFDKTLGKLKDFSVNSVKKKLNEECI